MELPVVGQKKKKEIVLTRDCDATIIPSGEKLRLLQGDCVLLTQALGGSFTVHTSCGYLARIAAVDADAIGLDLPESEASFNEGSFNTQQVMAQLATVFDPEIPVNVVDLGLIYLCEATKIEGGGHRVKIEMSMTAPGCGMGDILREDVRDRVKIIPGVADVDVKIVWDPPWDRSRMSEAARLQLGML
ncbi:MAG: putative Fe-S cluster assembly protein SufT [Nitrospirae bacterium]|nr:putative Fe-S cluster assembly protein SufT [Candidatus Troglogloeales bacterium]